MPKITQVIEKSTFEIILERLAVIMAEETAHQFALTDDPDFNCTVWKNRLIPFQEEELPAINITLSTGQYSGFDYTQVNGMYGFNVDCYVQATAKEEDGKIVLSDANAVDKLHKLVRVVRAILASGYYYNLGLENPCVGRTYTDNLVIPDPGTVENHLSDLFGRLVHYVSAPEVSEVLTPKLIAGYETVARLYNTDKGYLYALPALYISGLFGLDNLESQHDVIVLGVSITRRNGEVINDTSMDESVYPSFADFVTQCLNGTFKEANNISGTFQLLPGQGIWYSGNDLIAGLINWDRGGFDVGFDLGFD